MKKFNGFEAYLILEGLKEVSASMKEGIEKVNTALDMYSDLGINDRVNKKNLNAEYTLLVPPHIPIIKNIGINPASKNK